MGSPLSVCPGMENEDIGGMKSQIIGGGWGQIIGGMYTPIPPGWAAMSPSQDRILANLVMKFLIYQPNYLFLNAPRFRHCAKIAACHDEGTKTLLVLQSVRVEPCWDEGVRLLEGPARLVHSHSCGLFASNKSSSLN